MESSASLPDHATSDTTATTNNNQTRHHNQQHHHHDLLRSSATSILLIVIPIISVLLLIAILVLIIMLRRLKSNNGSDSSISSDEGKIANNSKFTGHTAININKSSDVKKEGRLYEDSLRRVPQTQRRVSGVQVFTYKELELATNNFSEVNMIGNGGFGKEYRGVLSDGTVAAIKALRREGKHGERTFRIEVDLLSRLQSPHLVEMLGYCADQQHRLLIFEFMPNGSLQQHLYPNSTYPTGRARSSLNWGTRIRIALDCARALEYLHEYANPPIIHHDLKCSNILLDQNFRAKVSDFGLAKTGSDMINGQVSTRVLGTTGYLAPEYVSTGKLTTKSDVYSFGVVLLQLMTGRVPTDTRKPPEEHFLVSWALPRLTSRDKIMEMVDPALKGQSSKKDLIQVAAIAAVCVQPEANYRPLMTDVVQSLIPLVKNLSSNASTSSSRFQSRTVSPAPTSMC